MPWKSGSFGSLGDGLADQVDGDFRLPDFVGHDAEKVEGVGLAGMAAQHLTVDRLRLGQPAGLMMLQGLFKSGTKRGHDVSGARRLPSNAWTKRAGTHPHCAGMRVQK